MPANGKFTLTDSGKLALGANGKADVCDDCCGGPFVYAHSTTEAKFYKIDLTDGTRSQYTSVVTGAFAFDVDVQGNLYVGDTAKIHKYDSSGSLIWETSLTMTPSSVADVAVDENGRVCVVGGSASGDNIEFYEADGTFISGYDVGTGGACVQARGDGHFLVGGGLSDGWDDSPGAGDANKRNAWEFLGSDGSNTNSYVTGDPATETVHGVVDLAVTDDGGFGCAISETGSGPPSYFAVKFDSSGSYDYRIAPSAGVLEARGVSSSGNDCIYTVRSGSSSIRGKVRSYDSSGSLNWSVNLPTSYDTDKVEAIGLKDSLLLVSSRVSGATARVYNTSGSYQHDLSDTNKQYKWIKPITVGSTP